jgi:hypothetical protein
MKGLLLRRRAYGKESTLRPALSNILASVSSLRARRAAVAVLFALIAGAAFLAYGPLALGSVRLAGVSLLWWYAAVAAPAVAMAASSAALLVRES